MAERDTFTTISDGDQLNEGYFNGIISSLKKNIFNLRRTASNATYSAANDVMIMLSSTRYIAWDDSEDDIMITTNSGSSWSQASTAFTGPLDKFYVNPHDPNYITLHSSTWNADAAYSTDGGSTWTAITRPTDADGETICYSITTTGRIYCIFSDGGVGKISYSDNGGTSWTVVTGHQAFLLDTDAQIFSPKDDVILYSSTDTASNDGFTGYTINGGSAWTEYTVSSGGSACNYIALYIDSDNYMFDSRVSTNGGLYIIKWNGTTFGSDANDAWTFPTDGSTNFNTLISFDSDRGLAYYTSTSGSSAFTYITLYLPSSSEPIYLPTLPISYICFDGVSTTSTENRIVTIGNSALSRYVSQTVLYDNTLDL